MDELIAAWRCGGEDVWSLKIQCFPLFVGDWKSKKLLLTQRVAVGNRWERLRVDGEGSEQNSSLKSNEELIPNKCVALASCVYCNLQGRTGRFEVKGLVDSLRK